MAYGKSIELFLANGTADSLITAELSNWNGKAIKIPRIEVSDCKRDDIKGAGVYFSSARKRMIQTPFTSASRKPSRSASISTSETIMPTRRSSTGQRR